MKSIILFPIVLPFLFYFPKVVYHFENKAKIRLLFECKKIKRIELTKNLCYFYSNIYILSSNYSNKIFSNYFLVIISISIVLFLISSFTLIALNSEKIINDFKEKIPVVVFIKDESNKIELSKFEKNLEINNTIKKFDFISKKDAANKLSKEIGEDFIDYLGYNPLYDSYDIFFTSDNVNNLFIDQLVEEFKNESFVEEVTYDAPLIDLINKNILILKQWSLIIGSIFLFISIILMNNTIRLSVYSNRLNIKTMQLVGATKFFIKKPFIITHLKLGVLSSIISSVLLVVILYYLNLNFFEIDFEKIKESVFITLAFSLGISVIISYFSTSIITGRYISSNIEKLY